MFFTEGLLPPSFMQLWLRLNKNLIKMIYKSENDVLLVHKLASYWLHHWIPTVFFHQIVINIKFKVLNRWYHLNGFLNLYFSIKRYFYPVMQTVLFIYFQVSHWDSFCHLNAKGLILFGWKTVHHKVRHHTKQHWTPFLRTHVLGGVVIFVIRIFNEYINKNLFYLYSSSLFFWAVSLLNVSDPQ